MVLYDFPFPKGLFSGEIWCGTPIPIPLPYDSLKYGSSASPRKNHRKISRQISDTENLHGWDPAGDINVAAEAFVVDVVPMFPQDAQGLDLGDLAWLKLHASILMPTDFSLKKRFEV